MFHGWFGARCFPLVLPTCDDHAHRCRSGARHPRRHRSLGAETDSLSPDSPVVALLSENLVVDDGQHEFLQAVLRRGETLVNHVDLLLVRVVERASESIG